MLEELLFEDHHISKYHIIRFFNDDTNDRISGDYFMVSINSHGFMSVELILLEELDSIEILKNMEKIVFHNIYFPNASEIEIDEKIKIIIKKEELYTSIIFEAEDQKWCVPVESGHFKNKYFSGTLKLLLFSVYNDKTDLRNLSRTKRFYPEYFQATLEYKELLKDGKIGTPEFEKAHGRYFNLRWHGLTPFKGPADSFDSWAKEQEERHAKLNEK